MKGDKLLSPFVYYNEHIKRKQTVTVQNSYNKTGGMYQWSTK